MAVTQRLLRPCLPTVGPRVMGGGKYFPHTCELLYVSSTFATSNHTSLVLHFLETEASASNLLLMRYSLSEDT